MSDNINHNREDALDSFYQKKAQEYQIKPQLSAFDSIMAKVAHDPIDNFYQKKAETYQIEPKANAFNNIMSKSTIPQNGTSLLIKSLKIGGIAIGVSVTAWLIFSSNEKKIDTTVEKETITIEKDIPVQKIIEKEVINPSQTKEPVIEKEIINPVIDKNITQPSVINEKVEKKEEIKKEIIEETSVTPTITEIHEEVNKTEITQKEPSIKKESPREKFNNFFGKKDKKDSTIEIFKDKKKN